MSGFGGYSGGGSDGEPLGRAGDATREAAAAREAQAIVAFAEESTCHGAANMSCSFSNTIRGTPGRADTSNLLAEISRLQKRTLGP